MKVTIGVELVYGATPFAGRERVWGHAIVQVVQNGMQMRVGICYMTV